MRHGLSFVSRFARKGLLNGAQRASSKLNEAQSNSRKTARIQVEYRIILPLCCRVVFVHVLVHVEGSLRYSCRFCCKLRVFCVTGFHHVVIFC